MSWEDYYRSLLVDPFDYFSERIGASQVFRYIQTHPDLDHMSGLNRFFRQEEVPLYNFWDIEDHEKSFEEADFVSSPYSYADWLTYELLRLGHPNESMECKVLRIEPTADGQFWNEDGLTVLSPTRDLVSLCNIRERWNDASYILKLDYGGRTLILPGDAESSAWSAVVDSFGADDLRCDVLKAAHHGRESGYNPAAVTAMEPDIVVCSVGKKPSTDASDEYASHGCTVLSTRFHGTITMTMWSDGEVWIDSHSGERIATLPPL